MLSQRLNDTHFDARSRDVKAPFSEGTCTENQKTGWELGLSERRLVSEQQASFLYLHYLISYIHGCKGTSEKNRNNCY